jgi:membrane fusion protein (multidrug efflux system)
MPETFPEDRGSQIATGPSSISDEGLLIRMLHEEQSRLRRDVDELRQKQREAGDKQGGGEKDKDGQEKGKKDEKQGKGEKGEDSESKDGKDDEEKQGGKDEAEKKPPLVQRARAWAKEHPIGTVLIVIGAIVLIICAILLIRYLDSYENTDDAFVDGHTDPITPRINGIVTGVYVENTYFVKKGEVLVELDPRDFQVALEQAKANLSQADAGVRAQTPNVPITETNQSTTLVNAQLSVSSATANLVAAQEKHKSALSDLAQAQANEANATREEERYRLLVGKEEVSKELYDQRATSAREQQAVVASREQTAVAAEKAVTQAEAALGQARQQANEAQRNLPRQVAIQRETLSMRNANLQAAQAQVDQAALNLAYTKIYAPADGIIGDKSVQLGTQVAPGQEMMALTQTNDIWVTANFKETQIKRMQRGESVTIYVDALSQKFDGFIEALPGASGAVYSLLPPENATGNYVKVVQRLPVRIRFKQGQVGMERLAPGMSVEPKVWLR